MTRFNRDWASIARRDGYADGKAGKPGSEANQYYQRGWREGNKAREKKEHQSCAAHPCGPKCPHVALFHRGSRYGFVAHPVDDVVGRKPEGETFAHRLARLRKIAEQVPFNFNADHAHQWEGLATIDHYLDAIPPTVMLELIDAAEANQLPQEVATLALTEAENLRERLALWLHKEAHQGRHWDDHMYGKDTKRMVLQIYREKADRLLAEIRGEPSKAQPTWCRMHGAMDDCPEHCPHCGGYFHSGPCARPTSTARDGGGSVLEPRWPDGG